jgi:8-amino-7-oxononanoate synthase
VDIVMGTLGKALGVSGAFIAGSRTLREYLLNRARPFIFSTATPPALAAGVLAALRIIREEPWRRERLRTNIARLRAGLDALGRAVSPGVYGHIVPIVIGESDRTAEIGRRLAAGGLLVGAVRPPSVPLGKARLRITLSAAHTEEQIDGLISALGDVLATR